MNQIYEGEQLNQVDKCNYQLNTYIQISPNYTGDKKINRKKSFNKSGTLT